MTSARLTKVIKSRKRKGRGTALPVASSNFLRAWREMSGFTTQQTLAKASGVSRSVISRLEAGQLCYREDQLISLAIALDAHPAELLSVDPTNLGGSFALYQKRLRTLEDRFNNKRK